MYTTCNDQIREISKSVTLNIYHFFVLGTFKNFLHFEIHNKLLLILVTLLCYRTMELVLLSNCIFVLNILHGSKTC